MLSSEILLGVAGVALMLWWSLAPRCPECGCLWSHRTEFDSTLRQCRRCYNFFRPGTRGSKQ